MVNISVHARLLWSTFDETPDCKIKNLTSFATRHVTEGRLENKVGHSITKVLTLLASYLSKSITFVNLLCRLMWPLETWIGLSVHQRYVRYTMYLALRNDLAALVKLSFSSQTFVLQLSRMVEKPLFCRHGRNFRCSGL